MIEAEAAARRPGPAAAARTARGGRAAGVAGGAAEPWSRLHGADCRRPRAAAARPGPARDRRTMLPPRRSRSARWAPRHETVQRGLAQPRQPGQVGEDAGRELGGLRPRPDLGQVRWRRGRAGWGRCRPGRRRRRHPTAAAAKEARPGSATDASGLSRAPRHGGGGEGSLAQEDRGRQARSGVVAIRRWRRWGSGRSGHPARRSRPADRVRRSPCSRRRELEQLGEQAGQPVGSRARARARSSPQAARRRRARAPTREAR